MPAIGGDSGVSASLAPRNCSFLSIWKKLALLQDERCSVGPYVLNLKENRRYSILDNGEQVHGKPY